MDDRKLKVLAAVVDEYIRTGEPVGSKTISQLEHIKASSATIRNDMAVLEQLGYQAESGTWRNAYLTGALELRQGNAVRAGLTNISAGGVVDMMQNMTASNILDFLAILLDKAALAERDFTINFNLKDTGERFALRFKNGAVLPCMGIAAPDAGLSVTTKKDALFLLMGGQFEPFASVARLEGDVDLLKFVVASCNQFSPTQSQDFNIVEP